MGVAWNSPFRFPPGSVAPRWSMSGTLAVVCSMSAISLEASSGSVWPHIPLECSFSRRRPRVTEPVRREHRIVEYGLAAHLTGSEMVGIVDRPLLHIAGFGMGGAVPPEARPAS